MITSLPTMQVIFWVLHALGAFTAVWTGPMDVLATDWGVGRPLDWIQHSMIASIWHAVHAN